MVMAMKGLSKPCSGHTCSVTEICKGDTVVYVANRPEVVLPAGFSQSSERVCYKLLRMKKSFLFLVLVLMFSKLYSQTHTPFIVVDQFGYLPDAPKIAVIRNPQVGFDSFLSFTPGSKYALVNAKTQTTLFSGSPVVWNNGSTDASSGDKAWWFDFSEVTTTGTYYVLDVEQNLRSYEFRISPSAYNEVFKHAVRTFFYQRAGFAKEEPYAEKGWVDGASHLRDGQDLNARLFNATGDASAERDVSGGWYDAGDYNKYTNWTADYVVDMMLAYLERPDVWTDDFNIPESGNGIPDLLDEAKWGLDHLLRLQNENGSVLSVVGLASASPPSAATGPSRYGSPNTSATLTTSAAFAISSKVYRSIGMEEYADQLLDGAVKAWEWAEEYPDSIFRNNDSSYGSKNLAAGQQEVDDYGRLTKKLRAAAYLFEATAETVYRDYFESNYLKVNMFQWNFAFPFQTANQDMVLYYSNLEGVTPSVATNIKNVYRNAMTSGSENFPAYNNKKDPYMAHIKDYTWGSNGIKARKGGMFMNMITFGLSPDLDDTARDAAIGYINYIHGVNPLNMVYLSNMYKYGAKNSVNEFYHTWYANKSARWDRAGVSTYGPAPGFLTGGPNPSYNWDGCCPSGCGSPANNAICKSESIIPPRQQPHQKSYKDFNTSWPLNSWSVTENSNGYQLPYIRLLSHFIDPEYDCNGDLNGTAVIDACGECAGGNTGITPETNPDVCQILFLSVDQIEISPFAIYPNPVKDIITIQTEQSQPYLLIVHDLAGNQMISSELSGSTSVKLNGLAAGVYMVTFVNHMGTYTYKMIKTD
jgi:endoglucanase